MRNYDTNFKLIFSFYMFYSKEKTVKESIGQREYLRIFISQMYLKTMFQISHQIILQQHLKPTNFTSKYTFQFYDKYNCFSSKIH